MASGDEDQTPGFVRISDFEFAAGWVPGYADDAPLDAEDVALTAGPVQVLERLLLEALLEPPCIIGFSGGRDSSALLAVAVQVARREGLDLPVPVTKTYPDVPATDETDWQELVIRWLGVDNWVRHEYRDELDLLGPAATASLRQHGLLWPGSAHNRGPTLGIARGGCYVDGEGGDEILGEFRITPVKQIISGARPLDRRGRRDALYALAPARLRRGVAARQVERWNDRSWLRPEVADWYAATSVADVLRAALPYSKGVRQTASRRAGRVALANLDAVGRSLGVRYVHPFLAPDFVRALGAFGGRLGFVSRTATMRALFTDLLPDEVNARDGKVYFNNAFIHGHSRAFLEQWDGTGLDPDLIDVDALREVWRQPTIHSGTFQLMQAAWLGAHGPSART
jgi:asparagine synthetase B (glutamine-hydrolysing)